jgi:hypothetical protein
MRTLPLVIGMVAMAAGAATLPAVPAGACSVFDRHPCAPTVCSVFQRRPCMPEFEYPLGQDLRLTIVTPPPDHPVDSKHDDAKRDDDDENNQNGEHKLDSIKSLFAALRGCWVPPDENELRPGMQMAVRFSFKRTGEIIGTPRVTYTSPDAPQETRDTYHNAVTASLERCTPMQFSRGLGGAIAGRPIAIRFVDNRTRQ